MKLQNKYLATAVSLCTVISVCIAMTACTGNTDTGYTTTAATTTEIKGVEDEVIFEEIEDISVLPQTIQNIIDDFKFRRGYARFTEEESTIVVSMGEKPTAGYSFKITKVENIDNITRITVKEQTPGEGETVAQVLTYPITIIRLADKTGEVSVIAAADDPSAGTEYELLADGYMTATGQYQGQIDNTSIEIDVDENNDIEGSGEPMAFRLSTRTIPYFDTESAEYIDLKMNEKVRFTFYKNELGQMILLSLEKI